MMYLDRIKFLLLCLVVMVQVKVNGQTVNDYYRSSMQAYEENRFDEFLEYAKKADSLRPNHRTLLYNVAAGYALNDKPEDAFQILKYRIGFYAVNDFEEDHDFKSLSEAQLKELKRDIAMHNEPKQSSELVFELDSEEFHAEDITYHQAGDRFFISDVHNGLIVSVGMEGEGPKEEFDLKGLGYWSALGLAFDPKEENILWVTSSMMNVFSTFVDSLDGKSVVLKFDVSNGELLASYELPGKHVLGELVISDAGDLYITDSIEPYIYSIKRGSNEIEEFLTDERWFNLQGIDIDGKNNLLYISDYITGSYRVDLLNNNVEPIYIRNEFLYGTDGLSAIEGKLILLQNGTTPKRITMLSLQNEGSASAEVLDQSLSFLDEPTMGTFIGRDFYFIANSPWPHYDREVVPLYENWKPIQIRKLSFK